MRNEWLLERRESARHVPLTPGVCWLEALVRELRSLNVKAHVEDYLADGVWDKAGVKDDIRLARRALRASAKA